MAAVPPAATTCHAVRKRSCRFLSTARIMRRVTCVLSLSLQHSESQPPLTLCIIFFVLFVDCILSAAACVDRISLGADFKTSVSTVLHPFLPHCRRPRMQAIMLCVICRY